jgi:hypothetical protein
LIASEIDPDGTGLRPAKIFYESKHLPLLLPRNPASAASMS